MKKITLSTLSLMVALGVTNSANALTWANADEDLSALNADITCDSLNVCTLKSTSATGMNGQLVVASPINVSDFIFLDTDGTSNLFQLQNSAASSSSGVLEFQSVTMDNVSILGSVYNTGATGYAVYMNAGNITNNLTFNGDIKSSATGGDGILITGSTSIGNDLILDGSIYSYDDYAFFANALSVGGDVNVLGTITARDDYGLRLQSTTILGAFNLSGAVRSLSQYGFYAISLNITENFNITGSVSSQYGDAFYYSGGSIGGDLDVSGSVSGDDYGMYVSGVTIGGNLNISGSVRGEDSGAIYLSGGTINGDINISGSVTNTTGNQKGLYINNTTMSGDINLSDTSVLSSRYQALYISGSNSTVSNLVLNGAVSSLTAYEAIFISVQGFGDILNTGTVTGYAQGMEISNSTVNSITNEATGIITAGQGSDNAIEITNGSIITNSIVNNGTINGNITVAENSSVTEGIILNTDSVLNGEIINDGTISSTTGAAIQYNAVTDATLTYGGKGVLSGATYGIDMGDGNDRLNLSGIIKSDITFTGVEILDMTDAVFHVEITDLNKESVLMSLLTAETTIIDDLNFNILTTEDILMSDSDGIFTLIDSIPSDLNVTVGYVDLDGILNYNAIAYEQDGQILMEYGSRLLSVDGAENQTLDLKTTCTDTVCTIALQDKVVDTKQASSLINITDIAEGLGLTDIVIQKESIVGAGDQVTLIYSKDAAEKYITISGENYINFINNADIYHNNSVRLSTLISLEADSILHGDLINNGDLITAGAGKAISLSTNTTVDGSIIVNGNIQSQNGSAIYGSSTTTINNDFIINGNINASSTAISGSFSVGNDFIWIAEEGSVNSYFSLTNMNIGNDFIVNAAMEGNGALYFSGGNIGGNMTIDGDFTSLSNTDDAFSIISTVVEGDLTINMNTSGDDIGILLKLVNVGGLASISGTIEGGWDAGLDIQSSTFENGIILNGYFFGSSPANGVSIDSSTVIGEIVNNGIVETDSRDTFYFGDVNGNFTFINSESGQIIESSSYSAALYIGGTNYGSFVNNGLIQSENDGIKIISWSDDILAGYVQNNGDINANHRGINISGFTVEQEIINSGNIIASPDWINSGGGKNETFGIFVLESSISGITNTKTGFISGKYGVALSAQHYDGDMFGRSENDTDLTIHNDGEIIGTQYAAIAFDVTALHGDAISFDNTLNYSGNGTLNGREYDIYMGEGFDVVNITNSIMEYPKIEGAEELNITDSVLNTQITENTMQSTVFESNGVVNLSLDNVTFNLDGHLGKVVVGDQLVLFEVETINANLERLQIDFNTFDASGYFDLVSIEGENDQLIYVFESFGNTTPFPDQAAQADPQGAVTVALRSVDVAATLTSTTLSMIQKRQSFNKYAKAFMRDTEFASSSEIQTDVNAVFGNNEKNNGVWLQMFSQEDEYKSESDGSSTALSSIGYEASLSGFTFGDEYRLDQELLIGMAFSHISGTVNGQDNSFKTNINSVQISSYITYEEDNFFVDGIIGYGIGMYKQERDAGDGLAVSDYDNQQFSAQLNIGHVFYGSDKWTITPYTKMIYMVIDQNAYEETKNGEALAVEGVSQESIRLGAGVETGYIFNTNSGSLWPRISLEYASELGDDGVTLNTKLIETNLPGTSLSAPEMGISIYRVGIGLTYISDEGHQVSIDYQKEIRDNYESNSIFVKGKYVF